VNATGTYGDTWEQVSGASYREILDTSDWDQSVAVNTPGQSGQPGSPHYSDLMPLWTRAIIFRYSIPRRPWRLKPQTASARTLAFLSRRSSRGKGCRGYN